MVAYGEDEMTEEKLVVKQLRLEEGFRSVPYRDTLNHFTVGYGWNIEGRVLTRIEAEHLFGEDEPWPVSADRIINHYRENAMSKEDAEYILEHCIHIAEGDCQIIFGKLWNTLPVNKKVPLIDMAYNLGIGKMKKFRRMIAAVKKGDWKEASKQVRNSLAAVQAPSRYKRIAKELEGN